MLVCSKRWLNLILALFLGVISLAGHASESNDVTLYTPYTEIAVPPGQSIDYKIDIINKTSTLQNVPVSLSDFPRNWIYSMKSGGWSIKKIAILAGAQKTLSLKVEVPYRVNKGVYHFAVKAGNSTLPLVVIVSKQGTFKTEFTTKQANMEGHSKSNFAFKADLRNSTGDKQLYSLRSMAPRGWDVTFKVSYKQVASVEVEANSSTNININITPPSMIEAGTYKIPVIATTDETSAKLELEVVITGTYGMELETPTGLLSSSITAGDEKQIELLVKNTGTSDLTDVKLSHSAPSGWNVTFDPTKIDKIKPGQSEKIYATVKASKEAIPGDYMTTFKAKTPEADSSAAFRMSVKTPMLWGWVGVLVILVALGGIFFLFRRYGRR